MDRFLIRKEKESRYGLSSDGERSSNYPPPGNAVPVMCPLVELLAPPLGDLFPHLLGDQACLHAALRCPA
jgi:hypothetical protein